jgi:DeoR/GlpR family transcriptional regulator of sugar metabolism
MGKVRFFRFQFLSVYDRAEVVSTMARSMFVEERRRLILEHLRHHGRVLVSDLSELLNVSTVTIRYDLRSLEESGLLERTYGGAVLPISWQSGPELSFDTRQRRDRGEKDAIARTAASMVQSGHSIALDASTTAFAMVPYLKRLDRLVVVTNSLMVTQSFLDSPQIQVMMPGGRLRRDSIALVGQAETVPNINLNIGFFGTRGISPTVGITDTDPDEVAIKQALMARCLTTVIVVHHDKFDQVAPYPFAALDQVQTIITTPGIPDWQLQRLREHGVEVVLAMVRA